MKQNRYYCGIDEVGRGAFAGPLVAASVNLTQEQYRRCKRSKLAIRDSKTLSELQRERVYDYLLCQNITYQIETVDVTDINTKGIGWANTTAIRNLILRLKQSDIQGPTPSDGVGPLCIVDGRFPMKQIAVEGIGVTCLVDADNSILPVMLASIIAKVTRDRIMKVLHHEFDMYKWNENKGYGTKYHLEALRRYGLCVHHRTAFVQTAMTRM